MNHQMDLVRMVVLACSEAWAAAEQWQVDLRAGSSRLKVFLDGPAGLEDQIPAEVDFVEYVHNRQRADVHVLVTSSVVGKGRREYTVTLTGLGRFEGIQILTQVGLGGGVSKTATSQIHRGRPDTTDRDRQPRLPRMRSHHRVASGL